MKLMEILKEAYELENGEDLFEASKESIKKKYSKDTSRAFKMLNGKPVNKALAKRAVGKIKDKRMLEIRNEIVAAFMKGDLDEFKKIFNDTKKAREAIDYIEVLKIAHGGEKKLLATAGKKKNLMQKVFKLIDGISEIGAETEAEA